MRPTDGTGDRRQSGKSKGISSSTSMHDSSFVFFDDLALAAFVCFKSSSCWTYGDKSTGDTKRMTFWEDPTADNVTPN